MRKLFPLVLLFAALAVNAGAQSGRRNITPPPRIDAPTDPPSSLSPRVDAPTDGPISSPAMGMPPPMRPSELRSLPESLINRQLRSLDKGSFRIADYSGKVVVVNLWATWCGPCRSEVPEYEKVRKEFVGKDVEFIGLTTEDPRAAERVMKFVHDFNFGFHIAFADYETARTLMNGKETIPQTLVIAGDGRVVAHWRGYSRGQSRQRLRDEVKSALSELSSSARKP
jgi:thiol-disulfide isomerase/thioredoxin